MTYIAELIVTALCFAGAVAPFAWVLVWWLPPELGEKEKRKR